MTEQETLNAIGNEIIRVLKPEMRWGADIFEGETGTFRFDVEEAEGEGADSIPNRDCLFEIEKEPHLVAAIYFTSERCAFAYNSWDESSTLLRNGTVQELVEDVNSSLASMDYPAIRRPFAVQEA